MTILNDRSRQILSHIVEAYVETGEPVGSKTLSARLGMTISPATIRNVMADLEHLGLLYAPHTSAGRLPTEAGLRFFVHGVLEVGEVSPEERKALETQCRKHGVDYATMLDKTTTALSGLSACAGLVLAPKADAAVKYIEFIALNPRQSLVVMVLENGMVENRLIDTTPDMSSSVLQQASNYLNSRLAGNTVAEARRLINEEIANHEASLDGLTAGLVEQGLAVWSGEQNSRTLIVRGHARLLNAIASEADIERVQELMEALEAQQCVEQLLAATHHAEGVQIFIGAENKLFDLAGCSMILAPFHNNQAKIAGAIGVIGPSRLKYGRIIPMVDYTAKIISKLL